MFLMFFNLLNITLSLLYNYLFIYFRDSEDLERATENHDKIS